MQILFKSLFFLLSLFSVLQAETPLVLVTVAPYKFLVEQIAQDTVKVQWVVPPGASAHTFEPSPKEMVQAGKAKIWFRIGEPFETKAIAAIKAANPRLDLVDLRKGLNLLQDQCSHGHLCQDLHMWLSPSMVKVQVVEIYEALIRHFPEHLKIYQENLKKLEKNLGELDHFIHDQLQSFAGRVLMVSHPAYAYYCREFNLIQLPIEFEGKDPTAKQLNSIVSKAKESHVKTIFTQPQYSKKAAELIAKEIGASVVVLDPYAENYIENLRFLTEQIAKGL